MKIKKYLLLITILIGLGLYGYVQHFFPSFSNKGSQGNVTIAKAYREKLSNRQVHGTGTVIRVLKDDLSGSRHQRFLVRLPSGLTLLIAHNIDLSPKINDLKKGDAVEFYGEYEWNPKGGVVHWTHHDPHGRHISGWIKHNGRVYR